VRIAIQLSTGQRPLLDDAGALDIAKDLYVAWPDDIPATALRKFLREVPVDWNGMPQLT
jgi:hypothetical protein